jgi:hypothetical protein
MTQSEINFLTTKLKCCVADLAVQIADSLVIGGCDNTVKLILLISYVKEIAKYNVKDLTENCLSEAQFATVLQNAKDICGKCDCGDNSTNE